MRHSSGSGDLLLSLAIIAAGLGTVLTLVVSLAAFALDNPRAKHAGALCVALFLLLALLCSIPASQA